LRFSFFYFEALSGAKGLDVLLLCPLNEEGYATSILFTFFASDSATNPPRRSLRFRFVLFEVRMWLRNADLRLIFPDAVSAKRFFAALRVFILGIQIFPSGTFSAFPCFSIFFLALRSGV
jgi:hypothetical protein